jgi:hypothetical protein
MLIKIRSKFKHNYNNSNTFKIEKLRRTFFLLICMISFLCFTRVELKSQQSVDSRGKEFTLTFLPNFHNPGFDDPEPPYLLDSLFLYISSDKVCNVKIEAIDNAGNVTIRNININNPQKVYTQSFYHENYEIIGISNRFEFNTINDAEKPMPQHFRVTSTEDISLYAASYAEFSTDAFMVLPNSVLGNEYMIMSYNSDYITNRFGDFDGNSTPSQYIIVAIEDSTQINIKNKVVTTKNKTLDYNITLNKGESYLVQAGFENLRADLTGSHLKSNKPIAVFAGHQRSAIPYDYPTRIKSRDFLVEQMTPINLWGRNALVSPLPVPRINFNIANDIFRVLALRDNSEIYLNGNLVKTLNSGEFYESALDSSYFVKSNAPISVAVFKKTASDGSTNTQNYWGDPFMALIPPIEQFHNVYKSINIQVKENFFFFPDDFKFRDHYIVLYVNKKFANTVKIDGQLVDQSIFKQVGNSDFMYGNFQVTEGTHDVFSDDRLGVLIAGYGPANSYGYLGGISTIPQDYYLPEVTETIDCYQIDIIATDTLTFDRGIKGVEVVKEDNIELIIPLAGVFPTPVYDFSIRLIDKSKSGSIELKVLEANGGWIRKSYIINSKELKLSILNDLEDSLENKELNVKLDVPQNREKCYQIRVENPTNEDIEISSIFSKNNDIEVKNISNNIVPRGSFCLVDFCIKTDINEIGQIIDSLFVITNCSNQLVFTINLNVDSDRNEPKISETTQNCNQNLLNIQENDRFDKGLKSYNIIENTNCDITLNNFTNDNISMIVTHKDQTQDAVINISFLDSADNEIIYKKVFQGFTLSFIDTNKTNFEYTNKTFNLKTLNVIKCIDIPVYNYGSLPYLINSTTFKNNKNFSVPLSQLPIEILPNETKSLMICFYPLESYSELTDSLVFDFKCNSYFVGLNSEELPDLTVITKCGISYTISLINSQINLTSFFPNPTDNLTNIEITSDKSTKFKLKLINLFGSVVYEETKNINSGYNLLNYNFNELQDGHYSVIMDIEGREIVEKINILR